MIHHAKGTISRQARVNTPEGTYEEGFGRQGFSGARPTGILTLNPAGLHHGPQPGVEEASRKHWQKDARLAFTAVNIDTEQPLLLSDSAMAVEIPDYYTNWMHPATATTER